MPPPEIEAKKLTVVAEAQTVVALELIETKGLTVVFTVMVMVFDVAVETVAQFALLVSKQETALPLVKVVVLSVSLLVPADKPFTNH